ncbi:hypothetical protein O0L34_g9704 [Tuta absoluta]|nr:hypothetical protein O0L34_g9704 [Tuta absoluta]
MFLLGICIHLCFLFSIFDIYFKSPIVKNVEVYQPQHQAVAERLVLFMVDGLRAESFVNYTTMPYLRSIANTNGRWGLSHTRVPTESRPGHVAVIAGFYEDPSAVAKGWKANPVDFDSVFNQTTYTWCWGAYDIVEIFSKKENTHDHIFSYTFDPYSKTFRTDKNETKLDAWVFDNVETFFHKAALDQNLNEKLKRGKIAFFMHLLGTDTSGHVRKPKTKEFLTTIRHVDEGIKVIEKVIRDFYNDDGKTTFLMTSDHGMTDWGTHGAGDHHETQTPYVIWGAGVQQVVKGQIDPDTNKMSKAHRMDLQQADLTPLMSTILSIPVPVNSVGQLRSDLLNISLADRAKAIYSNSRQLAHQYDKKRSDIEADAIKWMHQPFEPFTKDKYKDMITLCEKLLLNGQYKELIAFSEEIMDLSLKGLSYYHNYYQRPLLVLVSLSFIGWIVCLIKLLLEQMMNTQDEHSIVTKFVFDNGYHTIINVILIVLILLSTFLVFIQNLPAQYVIYFSMPVFLWWYALSGTNVWLKLLRHFRSWRQITLIWMLVLCYLVGSVALAWCFTYRWMLSIPLCGMGLWAFVSQHKKWPTPLLISWVLSCAALSLFSFMSIIGKEVYIELVILAGFIWLLVMAVYLRNLLLPLYRKREEKRSDVGLTVFQMCLLVLSLYNIYTQSRRFSLKTAVSYVDQTIAWIIAGLSFVLPFFSSKRAVIRLMATYSALLNFYLLLSVSHEGLFMVTLIFSVTCWIFMEFELLGLKDVKMTECTLQQDFPEQSPKNPLEGIERSVSKEDFRRAFFYITFITAAFFGTGNIASLNSFEIRWVTCFITSFKPFIITGLILLKTMAPFLIVGCSFRAVQYFTKAPVGYMNVIVLVYSNIMGIQLLFYVKNTGSWLEIGTSISQFVIVQLITLFIVLINHVTKILTEANIYSLANEVFKTRKKYV